MELSVMYTYLPINYKIELKTNLSYEVYIHIKNEIKIKPTTTTTTTTVATTNSNPKT